MVQLDVCKKIGAYSNTSAVVVCAVKVLWLLDSV